MLSQARIFKFGPTTQSGWVTCAGPSDYVVCWHRDADRFLVPANRLRGGKRAEPIRSSDGDFRVVRPGAFVRCAVTGLPIPLEELKYWSVDLQEAYVNPEAVLERYFPNAGGRAADDRR